ncbi:metallophosphoesterase [Variovorax sp. RCC_210]|uniref:metallophosphoesterase n=1 Tax=Variovorax sp. RCC_210 TaxID=3239217 RepID=UPI003525B0F9
MPHTPRTASAVCDCSDPAQKVAVILYPSLGTPLLLAASQEKCSLFIAMASLGVANAANRRITLDGRSHIFAMDGDPEKTAAATVSRHLRLVGMTGPKPPADIGIGELTGDGKDCATAKSAIKVWRVGRFEAGALIYNQKGEVSATLSPQAVKAYVEAGFAGGYVYEVELELAKLRVQPRADRFMSFAWMVAPTKAQKASLPTLCAAPTVHAQDLLVESFLVSQVESPGHAHQAANANHTRRGQETCLVEYDVAQTARNARTLVANGAQRLAAWHPVIRLGDDGPLKLGHLSDVHINVRHNALAKSPARVIEDSQHSQGPVGSRVCNSFNALKELFDRVGAGGKPDTALLLTGDLIDFNRNIDPAQVPDDIGGQWKKFNVLNNFNTPGLYPRGQDDMLAFSLVRYAYNTLKLPVFMTSGNHEAYLLPYGISPRINAWGAAMGVLEDTTDTLGTDRYAKERAFDPVATVGVGSGAHAISRIGPVADAGRRVVNANKNLDIQDLAQTYRDFDSASQWHDNKANEGIAADHNMTIYEATLAYGPTYAQALTGNNYGTAHYDWFHVLFTPLEDVVVALAVEPDRSGPATQVIAALGWGQGENFKNLTLSGIAVTATDRQGTGILPRANQSFSLHQLAVLDQARRHKQASPRASLTVATHFTIVNYDEFVPYSAKGAEVRFVPSSSPLAAPGRMQPGFNHVNTGTCEINLDAYFARHVFVEGANAARGTDAAGTTSAVDWHFSGHSHRSGVYDVAWRHPPHGSPMLEVTRARDPGLLKKGETVKAPARERTRFIVSSCGGPIGKQNLERELDGWTLRPPAGTHLDPLTGLISQVSTQRASRSAGAPLNEKPRLCVALDYMAVMSRNPDKHIVAPLSFKSVDLGAGGGRVPVVLSRTMAKLDCIAGVRIWAFEKSGAGRHATKRWNALTPVFHVNAKNPALEFTAEDLAALARAINANGGKAIVQGFCEVLLKQPTVGEHDWSKDMDCLDPWVFPLGVRMGASSLGVRSWHFFRPAQERGEVPDWKFLATHCENRGYVPAAEVITGKKQEQQRDAEQ